MEKYQKEAHEKFLDWASKNMNAVTMFFRYADQVWNSGRRPIGAKLIVERMRWETTVKTQGEIFKINNSHTSHLARLYVQAKPDRKDLFRFRGDP